MHLYCMNIVVVVVVIIIIIIIWVCHQGLFHLHDCWSPHLCLCRLTFFYRSQYNNTPNCRYLYHTFLTNFAFTFIYNPPRSNLNFYLSFLHSFYGHKIYITHTTSEITSTIYKSACPSVRAITYSLDDVLLFWRCC